MKLVKNYFLGANSYNGFYSFFDYQIDLKKARRVICIKGTSGNGKSSLMKEIGEHFLNSGYSIEYNHCSSDPESLDGVVIDELNVAILDGTSPHVVDPKYPLVIDEILDLSSIFNVSGVKKHKDEIIKTNNQIKNCFRRTYSFLKSAKAIHEDIENLNSEILNKVPIKNFINEIKTTFLSEYNEKYTAARHMFSTGITPLGILSYNRELVEGLKNIFILNCGPGMGAEEILCSIENECGLKGYERDVYHDPFDPKRIESLVVKDLSLGIFSSNEINKLSLDGNQIFLGNYLDVNKLSGINNTIQSSNKYFNILIEEALNNLKEAKAQHDILEKYYVENADFNKLHVIKDELIKSIEN